MRIEYYGDGEPEIAVIGIVHGNEPCGRAALDHVEMLARTGRLDGCVAAIYANEIAAERNERTAKWNEPDDLRDGEGPDGDLNRAYDDEAATPTAELYERRLASVIEYVTESIPVYDFHSTSADVGDPFAIFSTHETPPETAEQLRRRVGATGVRRAVDFQLQDGSGIQGIDSVEIEHVPKGSKQAAEQAVETVERVLTAHGLFDGAEPPQRDTTVYEAREKIDEASEFVQFDPEPVSIESCDWEVLAADFERADVGDTLVHSVDEEVVVTAAEPFTPVLLSGDYETYFGYATRRRGAE